MPPKAAKPTSDELLAQFDNLDVKQSDKQSDKPKPATAPDNVKADEEDPLAELGRLATQRPSSGPGTPRLSSDRARPSTRSPRPSATLDRPSEEKTSARQSEETGRTSRAGAKQEQPKPEPETTEQQEAQGGGWWGGLFATANAAMKQAEAAVKEIQNNEEAQRWAQQVKGNVGALKDFGGELRNMAIPTFTNLIHTLAPPISSHERLQIHVTHDLSGYPGVDPLVYAVFSRVMSQVEGGDLLVIQRGQESAPKRGLDVGGYISSAGWSDGPWWRTVTPGTPRTINAVRGAVEASKLVRASAEGYATEYFSAKGGIEEAAKQATEVLSESNPVRSSDIFLAIQAICQPVPADMFQAGASGEKESSGAVEPKEQDEEITFALYLHDPIHGIAFHTISQAIPHKWIEWLDASAPAVEDPESEEAQVPRTTVPEAITEIIESGGVDPREWVAEWIEETLSLAAGVVAQRYVARRMGVGEGGVGKGKMRAEQATTVESGAGEAARAI
ncbi:uncharacterized protein N7443_002125 [Penicillium atrosanguineum]|uniref:uncharacterized protein n=1 Tax=Penicillium atrosanguineum TaxID=1132637 RepID=UPI002390CC1C|nr:uncharacterized protein N7443_002125 [Penicillium atrosanguineum]KAJ5309664.1 hypothetical protein N7443_002125 [Penicillium atrosanguineum]